MLVQELETKQLPWLPSHSKCFMGEMASEGNVASAMGGGVPQPMDSVSEGPGSTGWVHANVWEKVLESVVKWQAMNDHTMFRKAHMNQNNEARYVQNNRHQQTCVK